MAAAPSDPTAAFNAWRREIEVVEAINSTHENSVFLPGRPLDPAVRATAELNDLNGCDAWLVVTPAQHMRSVLAGAPVGNGPLILCSKGIEERSGELLHKVAGELHRRVEGLRRESRSAAQLRL